MDRIFLDHSIRALKRRGFTVVGTAMAIKRRQLMEFNGVTVFAVSDASLFSVSDGFRYDFSHHVLKKRMRLTEISRVPVGTVMETMSPNKTIVFGESEGRVTVNGVEINVTEVYHNRWIVVISALRSLDDVVDSSDVITDQDPSPAPEISFSGVSPVFSPAPSESTGVTPISPVQPPDSVPSPAPIYYAEDENVAPMSGNSTELSQSPDSVSSPAPIYYAEDENVAPNLSPMSGNARELSQSPSPIASGEASAEVESAPANSLPFSSTDESALAPGSPLPASSPSESTVPAERCLSEVSDGGDSAVFLAVEGEDLLCPVNVRRKLDESISDDVASSVPSDLVSGPKENQSEPLITMEVRSESKKEDQFMADDLFFYT